MSFAQDKTANDPVDELASTFAKTLNLHKTIWDIPAPGNTVVVGDLARGDGGERILGAVSMGVRGPDMMSQDVHNGIDRWDPFEGDLKPVAALYSMSSSDVTVRMRDELIYSPFVPPSDQGAMKYTSNAIPHLPSDLSPGNTWKEGKSVDPHRSRFDDFLEKRGEMISWFASLKHVHILLKVWLFLGPVMIFLQQCDKFFKTGSTIWYALKFVWSLIF